SWRSTRAPARTSRWPGSPGLSWETDAENLARGSPGHGWQIVKANGGWQMANEKWQRSVPDVVTSPPAIRPTFGICHLPSVIRHLPFVGPVDRPICWRFTGPWTPGTLFHKEFLMDGNVIDGT